jgi:hypothetical protein
MFNKLILMFLALTALCVGCRTKPPNAIETPANKIFAPIAPIDPYIPAEFESNDFDETEVSVMIGKSVYSSGEMVEITARLTNQSDVPAYFWMPNLEGPIIVVKLDAGPAGIRRLRELGPVTMLHEVEATATLAPHQSLERVFIWDKEIAEGVLAPPGKYRILVEVRKLEEGSEDAERLELEAWFRIEGGNALLEPEEVLLILVGDPDFSDWYDDLGSVLVCKYGSEQTWAIENLEVKSVTEAHLDQIEEGTPGVCAMHLEAGPVWRVNYASKQNQLAGEFEIIIDANSGEVLMDYPTQN